MISYSQRAIHRNADRHGMQPAQLDTLDDPDQTGLETAVHDTERTELSSTSDTLQALWPKRLEDLARRTVTSSAFSLDGEAAQSIHHHLDALEKIFGEMRTETTEDVQDPSQDNSPGSIVPDISVIEVHSSQPVQPTVSSVPSESDDGIDKEKILSQLKSLDSEVIALNKEIEQRRKESSEIRDLFEERCRGLARTVAELEDEVIELQGDLVEDSIELEGIQGTVRGLQDWIDGLREAQAMSRIARERSRKETRRLWAIRGSKGTNEDFNMETDGDIVLDGLTAWMRGWRDVEEGFQARSKARQTRREKRQEQLMRPGEKQEKISRRSWAS